MLSFFLRYWVLFFCFGCMWQFLWNIQFFCVRIFVFFELPHAFLNTSFKSICFKDQVLQLMVFFKCKLTTEKERPWSVMSSKTGRELPEIRLHSCRVCTSPAGRRGRRCSVRGLRGPPAGHALPLSCQPHAPYLGASRSPSIFFLFR